ncbi:hypothetical protein [Chromobacterium sp. IIBBL 290-4]|uniref:hypothetical protein n=1 Tax=Chromobacterium sp. IIBBL 290-4 TaxID=2953890 RepID=UPI0020B71E38|nr:hypothetical protein [Chromobacterium sp. IIBBL 290-4]UTH73331.1 hypothetical protein NKT35_17590 [Chromobacterium sp. IIBBL 290-4]
MDTLSEIEINTCSGASAYDECIGSITLGTAMAGGVAGSFFAGVGAFPGFSAGLGTGAAIGQMACGYLTGGAISHSRGNYPTVRPYMY